MLKTFSIVIFVLAALFVGGYYLTVSGGKPIGTDLSVIGQGKPSLVLAYQNYSPVGGEALNRLRKVRHNFDEDLLFIVADLGTPQGEHFARRYSLADGDAVFLTSDGTFLRAFTVPSTDAELVRQLAIKVTASK